MSNTSWLNEKWHPAILNMATNLNGHSPQVWLAQIKPFCGVELSEGAIKALIDKFGDDETKIRQVVFGMINALFRHDFLSCDRCEGIDTHNCPACGGDGKARLVVDDEDVIVALMLIWSEQQAFRGVDLHRFLEPFGWGDDVCLVNEQKWLRRTELRQLATGV